MTEIDLGADIEFKVKIAGKEYLLREPTVTEIELFKRDDTDGVGFVVQFLAALGLPEDVSKGLAISKMKKLVAGIVEGLSEKK